ncbi:thioesterase superfamily protein [Aspergillus oryzae]|uniref:Thioesterase superfamily protein n=1 Tax=Aspergillus oryzae TaxID=5062 RepID=A0A1S9DX96_ASPOZ|nr:thioesterase superfamily protein [Aspergillus oryzae]
MSTDDEDVDFFAQIPFARPHLDKSSPYHPVPFVTRYDQGDLSDKFFSNAIHTNDTIPRILALTRKEYFLPSLLTVEKESDQPEGLEEPHFVAFCQLESDVTRYINTTHGGVLAALLDETLGLCAETYRVFIPDEQEHLPTARVEVDYHSPVPTPGIIVIKTWVKRTGGRKWFLEAHVLDHEGSMTATTKSLYIRLKSQL